MLPTFVSVLVIKLCIDSRYQALLGNELSLKLRFIFYERDSEEEAELPRRAFPSGAWERVERTRASVPRNVSQSNRTQIVFKYSVSGHVVEIG